MNNSFKESCSKGQIERFKTQPSTTKGKVMSPDQKKKISDTLKSRGIKPSYEAQLKGAAVSGSLRSMRSV